MLLFNTPHVHSHVCALFPCLQVYLAALEVIEDGPLPRVWFGTLPPVSLIPLERRTSAWHSLGIPVKTVRYLPLGTVDILLQRVEYNTCSLPLRVS